MLQTKSIVHFRAVTFIIVLAMCLAVISPVTGRVLSTETTAAAADSAWGVGTLTDEELWGLIAQMTLSEKLTFVRGQSDTTCSTAYVSPSVQGCQGQAGYMSGVAHLGIPPLRLVDGPAGIRLSHVETALPAPVGLAASFDRNAAYEFGRVMGSEGRATNQDVLLAPMINQVSVPTAGRNFETLGEDPYLMAELVALETVGVQEKGLIATLKHYAMNDFENGRNATSVSIDEQSLMEMEMLAFESGVKAGAGAIMCSYNRVNDVYACSNDIVLNQILRGRFGFQGWVMSDWGATHRSSDLIYGLDQAMPSGSTGNGFSEALLTAAVTNGTVEVAMTNDFPYVPAIDAATWQAAVDQAVFRILKQMNNAGLLEGTIYGSMYTDGTPYIPPRPDLELLKPDSYATALTIAEKSATLLKNDGDALPLKNTDLYSQGVVNGILVMGPTATAPYIGGGGSANVTPYPDVISPYSALLTAAGPGANIRWVPGYDLDGVVMPANVMMAPAGSAFAGQNGWLRTQIDPVVPSSGNPPTPCSANCAPDQLDPTVNYLTEALPAGTAWRWQGTFTAPAAGAWQLKIFAYNQSSSQLYVDGLVNNPNRRINLGAYATGGGGFGGSAVPSWDKMSQTSKSHDPNMPKMHQGTWSVTFTEGETHNLDLRAFAKTTDPLLIQFRWVPLDWQTQKINEAVAAASMAKKVVIFAYDEGTEGSDRGGNAIANGLKLPGYQDALISAVATANPDTVVVLNTGDPVFMPWASQVKAILEMWYPGQMGGVATGNILMGYANPGGKLPVTFPDSSAPVGLRFPQDMQDPACADGTANYGTASSGPGNPNPDRQTPNPGICPLYPGVYLPGFLWNDATGQLHSFRTIDFTTNGIFVGYRWYDKYSVAPLYPFGYGLSYTNFKYSKLSLSPTDDGGFDVTFRVQNVGNYAGDEVPQVYVGPSPDAPLGAQQAVRKLVQFDRISLAPGHWQDVTLHVTPRALSYWSADVHDWVLGTGLREVSVGSSSRDLGLQGTVVVEN
ncbi:MAG: glycoside hydrolase family 3 domain protein [Chloroflexi bacterium]|nr:glycoside hydrolase family 3 domain protein [Chloroflexota bacterium]